MAGCIYLHLWADPPERWCDKHDNIECEDCPDYKSLEDVKDEYFERQLQERRDGH